MKKTLLYVWLLLGSLGTAVAETFTVEDVRVDGLQRITAGSFFNYLPVRQGDRLDEADFPQIIRQLYQTDFFDYINLYKEGNTLIVEVEERPVIGEIEIVGNKEIKTDDLLNGLSGLGISPGNTFDVAKLKQAERELLNVYHARSKFDVIIAMQENPLPDNRVQLNVDIQEGISARIQQINIVGNKAFSEKEILKKIDLSTTKWHSLFTKNDRYSGDKLRGDIAEIEAFYLDRGFLDFKINSTQVSLTDDKKGVYITVSLVEGLPYRVKSVDFVGTDAIDKAQLNDMIAFEVGDYYARKAVRETQQNIKNALGDKSYAFSAVQIIPDIDRENNEVSLTYAIDKGRKTTVRRIQFAGNYKTNDEVLRREMRQFESAPYNHTKIARSLERIQRLQNITSVTRKEVPVAGQPDQVNIVYEVTESLPRTITAGVGYGSSSGFLFNLGYETANFFGTGNTFAFDFNNSTETRQYSFTFTDPYYTENGVSRTFNLYYREQDEDEAEIGDWTSDNWGAFLRYGIPINEYESFRIGGGYRGIEIKTGDEVAPEIPDYLAENGERYDEFVFDFAWTNDTRDKTVFSTSGAVTRLNAEIVVPGSDETYYKLGARNRTYFGISDNLLLSVRGDLSYGDGYGSTEELPFFRNYYAGGLTTIRGFESNSLGPKWSNDDVRGGNLRVTGGAEVIFPWYLGQDAETVRVGSFVDFGNVYSDVDDFDVSDFRYSAGLFLIWRSPVGPLNLSYGVPLNEEDGDKIENFQFTIGVPL
ncbi:outer membrane protein assembly factor BamA [Ostreibacterium oceani]|uniref:Outer membrane protein assembly factor BamA n=1 Tax=Ostreibacterium oceani TaxID=2654998 RepID=A0A6N7EUB7_9GAMM|nr:outer membrane protein assembly factor BamA [Ostreibacterium oceani]MPV85215.1 outer membrane protein assembly factor BamA [Ostreibacterium oceani]